MTLAAVTLETSRTGGIDGLGVGKSAARLEEGHLRCEQRLALLLNLLEQSSSVCSRRLALCLTGSGDVPDCSTPVCAHTLGEQRPHLLCRRLRADGPLGPLSGPPVAPFGPLSSSSSLLCPELTFDPLAMGCCCSTQSRAALGASILNLVVCACGLLVSSVLVTFRPSHSSSSRRQGLQLTTRGPRQAGRKFPPQRAPPLPSPLSLSGPCQPYSACWRRWSRAGTITK